jgi:hypothetical protein
VGGNEAGVRFLWRSCSYRYGSSLNTPTKSRDGDLPMFRITMEVDGKPVNPENFADELKRATYRSIEQGIVDQVSELRCPVHGEAADVTLSGSVETDDLRMTFKTCCEDFERAVLDAVGAEKTSEQQV